MTGKAGRIQWGKRSCSFVVTVHCTDRTK